MGIVTTRIGLLSTANDGSFAIYLVAGCVPVFSCGINEPTDWEIGAK